MTTFPWGYICGISTFRGLFVGRYQEVKGRKYLNIFGHFVYKQMFPITFYHFYRTARLGIWVTTLLWGYICGISTFSDLFWGSNQGQEKKIFEHVWPFCL